MDGAQFHSPRVGNAGGRLRRKRNFDEEHVEAVLDELETALGHAFATRDLLVRALTHRSLANERGANERGANERGANERGANERGANEQAVEIGQTLLASTGDNERLEFLGDAVLGLVVAEALFRAHPEWHEGELTRVRAQLVSRKHMAEVAQTVDLGKHLRLSRGEERGGLRNKATVLSNSMEAVIGAMFVDGGLTAVTGFVLKHVIGEAGEQLAHELLSGEALGNYKSALQEYLQSARAGTPAYRVRGESGPDHRKRFLVEVRLKAVGEPGQALARGKGSTKKLAEQDAARLALERLKAGEIKIGSSRSASKEPSTEWE
jgi:ribonuclease-3